VGWSVCTLISHLWKLAAGTGVAIPPGDAEKIAAMGRGAAHKGGSSKHLPPPDSQAEDAEGEGGKEPATGKPRWTVSDTARLLSAFADERVRAALTREFTEGFSRSQMDADRSGPGLWDGVLEIFLEPEEQPAGEFPHDVNVGGAKPQARGAGPLGPRETIPPVWRPHSECDGRTRPIFFRTSVIYSRIPLRAWPRAPRCAAVRLVA